MSTTSRSKPSRAVWYAIALALIATLPFLGGGDASPAPTPAATTVPDPVRARPAPVAARAGEVPPARPQARRRWWKPGQPHDYGTDVDPFIRQPQDYGSDTPAILGNRISYHVYDLELVQDMVRRGEDPGSELAQVRGAPLSFEEREAARRVLQRFFDETVPDVDGVIAGALSRDDGYARIGPRRVALDHDLRAALRLTEKQFAELWPHIATREQIRDELTD